MQVRVRDLMTASPVSVPLGTTLLEAAQRMIQAESAEIYVTDAQQRLVGVIPEYNFLKLKLQHHDLEVPVESVMHVQLESLSPDDDALHQALLFRDRRNSCMPVTEQGRLVGKLSCRDLFRMMLTMEALEAPEEQQDSEPSTTTEYHCSSDQMNPPHLNRLNSHKQLLQMQRLSGR